MAELSVTSYGRKVIGEKSRLLSLVLSFFFFAGFGILYAGNLKKGLIFFFADLAMWILIIVSYIWLCVSTVMASASLLISPTTADLTGALTGILVPSILMCVACLVILVLRIVSMVFGYQMCKENNQLWTNYLENN